MNPDITRITLNGFVIFLTALLHIPHGNFTQLLCFGLLVSITPIIWSIEKVIFKFLQLVGRGDQEVRLKETVKSEASAR